MKVQDPTAGHGPSSPIAIVTVNWNGWRDTLRCLEALRASVGVEWQLFIVDNASTDESPQRLLGLGDDVVTILSPTNTGWTGGNNLGVARALEAGHEHILLLNNDAFVEADTLSQLLNAHALVPEAILGGVLRSEDGAEAGLAGSRMDPLTGIPKWVPLHELSSLRDGLLATESVVGGVLFAHRSVFERIGPFDDDFYLYYDETDWCARAAKAGTPRFVAERASVRHVGAASTGGVDSPLVIYFLTRNSLLFTSRHSSMKQHIWAWRIVLGRIRAEAKASGIRPWPLGLLKPAGPCERARIRGMVDFIRRRLGDCPASVRDLQRSWRATKG